MSKVGHTEDELRFSNLLLATQREVSPDGILSVDPAGKIISYNRRFVDMCRMPQSVIESMSDARAIAAALGQVRDPEQFAERIKHLYAHPEESSHDRIELLDGRILDRFSGPIKGPDGAIYGRVWFFRDVTEQVRRETELRISKEQWEKTFDSVPDCLSIIGRDHKIIKVNKAMAGALKRTPEECIGLYCYEHAHGTTQPPDFCPHSALCLDGKEHTTEIYEPRLGGHLLVTVSPIRDQDGSVLGCVHIARDINASKQHQLRLQETRDSLEIRVAERTEELTRANNRLMKEVTERIEAEKRFSKLFTDSPLGMAILNPDFAFTSVNPAFCSMLGYTEFELLWRTFKDITHPDHIEENIEAVKKLRSGASDVYRTEKSYLSKTGKRVWASVTVSAIRNDKREFLFYLAMVEDISERKEAEESTRIQNEQLIQASKLMALGTLVSGVAHEINNPNQFIMLNTPVLENLIKRAIPLMDRELEQNGDFLVGQMKYSDLRPMIPNLTGGIRKGSQRIKQIVEDLRQFVREGAVKAADEVNVAVVIDSAISLMQNMIRKATSRFKFTNNLKTPRRVRGSAQRIEQVVINLIQNSCQALPDKDCGVEILLDYEKTSQMVVITVRDEGTGISPETMARIREPFFTTKRESGGTGLGLSISDRIVKEHGGSMEFTSEQGKGTTVRIMIPEMAK